MGHSVVVALLAALFVIKLLATSISIGSGASGGIFTPSLFLGAALGATFGLLVAPLGFTAPAGAYALVGMAAFTAAATRGAQPAAAAQQRCAVAMQVAVVAAYLVCVVDGDALDLAIRRVVEEPHPHPAHPLTGGVKGKRWDRRSVSDAQTPIIWGC